MQNFRPFTGWKFFFLIQEKESLVKNLKIKWQEE